MSNERLLQAAHAALVYLEDYRSDLFDDCTVQDEKGNVLVDPDEFSLPFLTEVDLVISDLKAALAEHVPPIGG
jgi:hypothetical protein